MSAWFFADVAAITAWIYDYFFPDGLEASQPQNSMTKMRNFQNEIWLICGQFA